MGQFIDLINNQYQIANNVKKANGKFKTRRNILAVCTGLFAACTIVSFVTLHPAFISTSIILLLLASIFLCIIARQRDFYIDFEIITATNGIENLFNQWNSQYFLPNGLYVMAPRNLKYIQFVLDPNTCFQLENHAYPFDIMPKSYRGNH
jgi:hypothetical protein